MNLNWGSRNVPPLAPGDQAGADRLADAIAQADSDGMLCPLPGLFGVRESLALDGLGNVPKRT